MKIHIITIGDEILIGQIVDTNSAWMAGELNRIGARVSYIHSISDDGDAIRETLDRALEDADAVLLTGGLGPTKDDLTKKALADYFGVEFVFHEPTLVWIQALFERIGRPMKAEALHDQYLMPANAVILPNKMGTAPGMWFEHQGKVIVSMPGVPSEMKYLMRHEVLPKLKARFGGKPIQHRTILTVGEGETIIAGRVAAIEDQLPPHVKLAYLPAVGQVRLRLTGIADDAAALEQLLDEQAATITACLSDIVYGFGDTTLEAAIGQMLLARSLTIGAAESCTGGHFSYSLTAIPGASAYFKGAVVAYDNAVKRSLLGVRAETLERYGAVSEQTVLEMAQGARELLQTDLAVSISGIAGPDGGTPEKPVGTIWMAIANKDAVTAQKIVRGKDRLSNIQYATIQALNMVRKLLAE
ncbi:MAG: competence/damage-inducible protein A [Saprospiraceae bacterium]|nr:competence/damage-inducible protein A [Saprospiraceae bacterium]MDZ4702403.1 competence/damage-inducible protein A [Saprospiraceae bacterium]